MAWDAICAAISPAKEGRFEKNDGDGAWGAEATGVVAVKVSREMFRFPGVELKTEYSSAKRGVQTPGSARRLSWRGLGVSNVGLGKAGVCRGVGGWAFGFPKLSEGPGAVLAGTGFQAGSREGRARRERQSGYWREPGSALCSYPAG